MYSNLVFAYPQPMTDLKQASEIDDGGAGGDWGEYENAGFGLGVCTSTTITGRMNDIDDRE